MKLSIVIVNYNVRYFLQQCLLSVQAALRHVEAEVFVVDNASTDGSVEMVRTQFPWVMLIANNRNEGFSKANNQAIRQSHGSFVLLLNPDTVVAEDTFEKCIAFMQQHPDAGALGVHMIDGSGRFLPESKRGLPTPFVAFCKAFGLSRLFPKSKLFNRYHLGYLSEHETHAVDVLSGAFMFIRREALAKAGLLDEAFFMYGEDIDLSYRITKAGFRNYYFAGTTILHYKGESTKRGSLNYVRVFYGAMQIFADKHFSGQQSVFFNLLIRSAIVIRAVLTVLSNLLSSSYLFVVDALLGFMGIAKLVQYWSANIKSAADYYPPEFLALVVPCYILIWLVVSYVTGAYAVPYRVSPLLRGIAAGTLVIVGLYGLVPDEWRFSRAIILLGSVWMFAEMFVSRWLVNVAEGKSFSEAKKDAPRAIACGSAEAVKRAEGLLKEQSPDAQWLGGVFADAHEASLCTPAELPRCSRLYDATHIIFCQPDVSYRQSIGLMQDGPHNIHYNMLHSGLPVLIGSHSKNEAADLKAAWLRYPLAQPLQQRQKRLFDFLTSVLLAVALPLWVLVKNKGGLPSNLWMVLTGRKTWMGVSPAGLHGIYNKPPVVDLCMLARQTMPAIRSEVIAQNYARNFSVMKDLHLLLRHFEHLGG